MRKGCSAAFLFLSCLSFRRSHLPASSGRPGKALSSVSLLNNILPLTGWALEEKEKRGRYKSSAALSFLEYSEFMQVSFLVNPFPQPVRALPLSHAAEPVT